MRTGGLFFFLGLALAATSPGSAAQGGFLRTDGIHIRDQNGRGDTVRLYGINFGGFIHESWMTPLAGETNNWDALNTLTSRFGADSAQKLFDIYWDAWQTDQDFRNIAEEGMNCVRYPFNFHDYMDDQGNWRLNGQGKIDFSRMDNFVAGARAHGLYTVLDMHGAPGSQNGADHSGRQNGPLLFSTPRYPGMLVKFWGAVAAHFKDDVAVAGYDIMNEPSETYPNPMGAAVVDLYDSAYRAIRKVDTNHIIFLEAIWTWDALPHPDSKDWANVVYELHHYQWTDNGDATVMKNSVDGWIRDSRYWQARYQVPMFTGEFSLFQNPESWRYGLSAMVEADWNWAIWTYKVFTPGSSWGLYTAKNQNENVPDMRTDDYATIAEKWGKWNTPAYFTRNPMLGEAIRSATALRKVQRPTSSGFPAGRKARVLKVSPSGLSIRIEMPHEDHWRLSVLSWQGETLMEEMAMGRAVSIPSAKVKAGTHILVVRSRSGRHSYARLLVLDPK